MSESTEMERAADRTPVNLGAQIGDLDAAYRLSKALAMAALMPDSLRGKPNDVLAVMLYGQDLGLSPMQSVQGIYVVKGKPQISGQLWIALAKQRGHRVFVPCRECGEVPEKHPAVGHLYVADHDTTRCTIKVIRGDSGESHAETFTIEDARTAKLLSNDNWTKYPKRMLLWRSATDCLRFIAPEIALGFYAWGDDMADETPVVVEVAQPEIVQDTAASKPEKVAEEVANLVGQFDFSASTEKSSDSDEVIQPEPSADYTCLCGAVGEHFEDDCPKAAADA